MPEGDEVAEEARKCVARVLCGLPVQPVERRVMAVGVVVAALRQGGQEPMSTCSISNEKSNFHIRTLPVQPVERRVHGSTHCYLTPCAAHSSMLTKVR